MSIHPPAPRDRHIVIAHPSGNQFFRHLTRSLHITGHLSEACTCLDWQPDGMLGRLLPSGMRKELGRRTFSHDLGVRLASHAWREAGRLLAGQLPGASVLTRHETGLFAVDAVYKDFDRWVARRINRAAEADTIYAYEDAAEFSFEAAKQLGWQRIYDLPIAHWETSRRLLDEEAVRWPSWEPTLVGTRDSAAKLARKTRELALAQVVVCPSRFVAESLPPEARARCRVIVAPFGSPLPSTARKSPTPGTALRVLFAGSMSQRKGLADLFEAFRLLNRSDVQLVVLGSPVAPMDFYRQELSDFVYEPPRPHTDVLALMRTCDVLCLPSIVEGRALVIQEAMGQGLPVIITPNTGADDAVGEGISGFVVPVRSPVAIAEKLNWFADHRDEWLAMSRAAQAAAARFTWENYAATVISDLAPGDPNPASSPPAGASMPSS